MRLVTFDIGDCASTADASRRMREKKGRRNKGVMQVRHGDYVWAFVRHKLILMAVRANIMSDEWS